MTSINNLIVPDWAPKYINVDGETFIYSAQVKEGWGLFCTCQYGMMHAGRSDFPCQHVITLIVNQADSIRYFGDQVLAITIFISKELTLVASVYLEEEQGAFEGKMAMLQGADISNRSIGIFMPEDSRLALKEAVLDWLASINGAEYPCKGGEHTYYWSIASPGVPKIWRTAQPENSPARVYDLYHRVVHGLCGLCYDMAAATRMSDIDTNPNSTS